MKVCLTGGIACGKSLLSHTLNELGIRTIDADDIVHELIPAEERRRLAQIVFTDSAARAALEARIHPLVKARIEAELASPDLVIAVIPLLFEVQWNENYDIICCVASKRENQIARMIATRGYSREEAEARLAAQMPVEEKAAKSHYVIHNDGSPADLKRETEKFVSWLKNLMCSPNR